MRCRLLAEALQQNFRYRIASANSVDQLLSNLKQQVTDVVLLSSSLVSDQGSTYDFVRQLVELAPALRVVMLLDTTDTEHVLGALRAGARGVFSRSDSFSVLGKCIDKVAQGEIWANTQHINLLVAALAESTSSPSRVEPTPGALLSKREEEVASLVAEGLTNREISQRLRLSEHTVKNYLFRIFDKLGLSTRVELTVYALSRPGVFGSAPRATNTGEAFIDKSGRS